MIAVANAVAKERKEPIDKLLGILGPPLIAYQVEQKRIAAEKEKERIKEQAKKDKEIADLKLKSVNAKTEKTAEKIEEKIEVAENKPVAAPVKAANTVKTEGGQVSFRETMDCEIIDESKIPPEYMQSGPDLHKIRRDVAKGKVTKMTGVRIFKKTSLTGRY